MVVGVLVVGSAACAGDRSGDGDSGASEAPSTTVRFTAVDGSLADETASMVADRLLDLAGDPELDRDEAGLTISLTGGSDQVALARLAAASATFEVAPLRTAERGPCEGGGTRTGSQRRDLRTAPGASSCWTIGSPVLTTSDVVAVDTLADQEQTVYVDLTAGATERFNAEVAELQGRRLAVSVGGWVVTTPEVTATEFAARIAITTASEAEADLIEAVLSGPELPDELVEPTETGPSGFGPSDGAG